MQTTNSFAEGRGKYPDHLGFKAPRDLRVRAQSLANREGVSLAEILRRAIERGIAEQAGQPRPC